MCIAILDTEGLLSIVGRDHLFDNKVVIMAFACSHLEIINMKGDINSTMRELIGVAAFAMKALNFMSVKPKILFVLRD